MNKFFYFILLSLTTLAAHAQGIFPSEGGLFTANYLKGCSGTTITVTPEFATGTYFLCFEGDPNNVSSSENQTCFNEQANEADRYSYTYTTPGTYTIVALRQITNSQEFDSLTINIIDPQIPAISAVNCNNIIYFDLNTSIESFDFYTLDFGDGSAVQEYAINDFPVAHTYTNNTTSYTVNIDGRLDNTGTNNCANNANTFTITPADLTETAATITNIELVDNTSFSIDYTLNNFQNYQIQLKESATGTYQNIEFLTNQSSGTYTFTNLDLTNTSYCARIVSNSLCGNTALLSNEGCSVFFTATATQNGNLLDWNALQFESSVIFKNGEEITGDNAPYLDENVLCGQNDNYYVEVTDANGITQQSFNYDVEALFGNPSAGINQINVNTLSDNELLITWEVPEGLQPEEYRIYKKRPSSDEFSRIDAVSVNEYTDIALDFNSKIFTYGISYTNACGRESQIQTFFQNILLKATIENNLLNLTWNSYNGYGNLFDEFIVNQYDAAMNLIATFPMASDTTYSENLAVSDQQKYSYQIDAISSTGAKSFSNIISYKIPTTFFVPSAFTPDGNGLNEELKVLGKFISEVDFKIFSRWGTLIFQSTTLDKGWDGYLTDRDAPAGSYTYTVTVIDQYGESYFKSGVFNLIR